MNSLKENPDSVSIIILTHGQREFLEKCIDSVLSQSHKPRQIIVLSNPAPGRSVDFLRKYDAGLEIMENKHNVGFGRAMNIGIKKADARYILLLADDIIIAPDCLSVFLNFIRREGNIGLLSGYMYNYRNKELIFSGKKVRLSWNLKQETITHNDEVCDTDLIPGAFIFTQAVLLKRLGGFDERYFFYFEDLDLTFRFKKAGYRNLIVPQAKAYHLEERLGIEKYATNKEIQFESIKNIMITYFKHARLFWLVLFFIRYMLGGLLKNIFNSDKRSITLETRRWILRNLIGLIKSRYHNDDFFTTAEF